MTSFLECFDIILIGKKEASRKAARQVRKLVYGSAGKRDKYKALDSIIEKAPREYSKIKESWRQENFVTAISVLYFLHNKESQPDFLFPWLCDLLQHPRGNIRYAAVRMFQNELGPLTAHLRCPNEKSFKRRAEQSNAILYELYLNLIELAARLWKPNYKRYKYIASLPCGPYKSVQMVLGRMQEDCGEDYLNRLDDSYNKEYFSTFVSILEDENNAL